MKISYVLTNQVTAIVDVEVPDHATLEELDSIGQSVLEGFEWDETSDDRIRFFEEKSDVDME